MPKAMQIATMKRIFKQLNPWADEAEVDWEALFDPEVELPANIAMLETRYPSFVWRREEVISPEIKKLREESARRRELEKERKEHLKKIEAHEHRLRGEVERVVSEEIGSLREELGDLKAQRKRIPEASVEELGELRKDIERTERTIHEMGLRTTLFWEKLKKLEAEKRGVIPTVEVPPRAETRRCVGEIPTGKKPTGKFDIFGKEIYEIVSRPCGKEFTIQNVNLENKFISLAIRSNLLTSFAAGMIRQLCPECQKAQYGNTLSGLVCEAARKGILSGDKVREVGLTVREFLDVCLKSGVPIPAGWII